MTKKHDELQDLCAALNDAFERVAPSSEGGEETTEEWALESTPTMTKASKASSFSRKILITPGPHRISSS